MIISDTYNLLHLFVIAFVCYFTPVFCLMDSTVLTILCKIQAVLNIEFIFRFEFESYEDKSYCLKANFWLHNQIKTPNITWKKALFNYHVLIGLD